MVSISRHSEKCEWKVASSSFYRDMQMRDENEAEPKFSVTKCEQKVSGEIVSDPKLVL